MKTSERITITSTSLILSTAAIIGLSACSQSLRISEVNSSETPVQTFLASFTPTSTSTPSSTPTPTVSPSATLEPTLTPTPSPTPSATPRPTYAILRGEVNVEQVSCFYGPSKAYLYKYLLLGGSNLDIIGILPDTRYIQVRAIGGDNPCWMNLEWMDVKGDINTVEPIDPEDILLPASPYYSALTNVSAVRDGNQVTISWNPLFLRAGDDSLQEPYLVETWVCQGGELTFVPIGAYITLANVIDEPGCEEPSHGRVYGVEKHGYTRYVVVPWPVFEDDSD
ncbi:MAG: hypothetical protein JXA25_10825 [Anaerolineales bacterium]|nr:hypothetical protein [Anaerolineales bacterium]